jgi:hypothetical protein
MVVAVAKMHHLHSKYCTGFFLHQPDWAVLSIITKYTTTVRGTP